MQGTPAGLPFGMPGMALEMDGAMQQAAQPGRQFMRTSLRARGAAHPLSDFDRPTLYNSGLLKK
jgi:hypothetical protein